MPTTNCEETFDRDTLPPIATFSILYILKKRYARERYGKKKIYARERYGTYYICIPIQLIQIKPASS
jgi:hypothetical protein